MKLFKKITAAALALCMASSMAACGTAGSAANGATNNAKEALYSAENPVSITVWNYYNGDQQLSFDTLVSEFNDTVGAEKGIIVNAVSQSAINNLADELINSVDGKVGAQDAPDLAAVYSETVYLLNEKGALADIGQYFTDEELSAYIDSFVEEGRIVENGELLSFPVSKSTETFICNTTDWQPFADATGITIDSVKTMEDLVAAAEKYYEYTDALTPDVANDGKALYGRDSADNYIVGGAYQLGHEIFPVDASGNMTVDLDKDTFKTLWDNYYIPIIKGWFGEYGSYRSDDAKTGSILALTSSTSGVSYIPTAVTLADDSSHDIEVAILPQLPFANAANDSIIQQGAGYCLLKHDAARESASAEFLKWFTSPERNVTFSLSTGYSPVTKAANDAAVLKGEISGDLTAKQQNMLDALLFSADEFKAGLGHSAKPFASSRETRAYLKSAFSDALKNDRAAVDEALASGTSYEDAIAPYISDEHFDEWFATVETEINAIVTA